MLTGVGGAARRLKAFVWAASVLGGSAGLASCSGDCPGCEVEVQPAAVNQPPVANAASVSVAENASVGIRLSGADADGSVVDYRA